MRDQYDHGRYSHKNQIMQKHHRRGHNLLAKKHMFSINKKWQRKRLRSLPFFCLFCTIIFAHGIAFFFIFWIEFGKAKQKVVALVAATLKALLSVAKTIGRLSGRKLYPRDIYDPFWNVFAHMSSYPHIKKVRNRSYAPKNTNSDCCHTN